MPIYEYKCRKCQEKFEAFRGIFSRDDKIKCPVCGEKNPQRVISRASTQDSLTRGDLFFPT